MHILGSPQHSRSPSKPLLLLVGAMGLAVSSCTDSDAPEGGHNESGKTEVISHSDKDLFYYFDTLNEGVYDTGYYTVTVDNNGKNPEITIEGTDWQGNSVYWGVRRDPSMIVRIDGSDSFDDRQMIEVLESIPTEESVRFEF